MPVLWPGGKQKQLFLISLQKHLLQAILAIAAVVLVGLIIMPRRPECRESQSGVLTGKTGRKVIAHLPGGDLELEWAGDDQSVFMTGPATEVFSGEWVE